MVSQLVFGLAAGVGFAVGSIAANYVVMWIYLG
jgi:hypothetical protein